MSARPLQSGADLVTPAHERVSPEQCTGPTKESCTSTNPDAQDGEQALLVAMQEKALAISGRSERSSGARQV